MLIKKNKKRKEEKKRRHTWAWWKKEGVEERREERERERERDVGVFYIRGGRRRRGTSIVKWGILVFLLGYFTDIFSYG